MEESEKNQQPATIWTIEQVIRLQKWQNCHIVHPFTCNTPECRKYGNLIPTVRGWICPFCDYTQNWAMSSQLQADPPPGLFGS